ncbi:unannotated protein [freshwater metagenome]|uniref:Unannotated protein n=1 Tax=freshwater metagenome TaxID=449393 RepID=A0A6J7HI79_9ZZZZ
MRRRDGRPPGQRAAARDARPGPHRAGEPGPPRGRRRGRPHGRRRGHPRPDPARVSPLGRGLRAARARLLRRGHVLPAAGRDGAPPHRGDDRAQRPHRGPAGPGLARRPGPRGGDRRHRQPGAPVLPADLHRGRPRLRPRPGRLRAQALRHPPHLRAGDARVLRVDVLVADPGLQGDAAVGAGAGVLPRPAGRALQVRDRPGALALLDEHVPELGPRAPQPRHRPQRRDQHPARQHQLDAGPRVAARLAPLRRGHRQDQAGRPPRRLGLRDVRQRPRAPDAVGPLAPARGDDDGPGGLRGPGRHDPRAARLLRVPLAAHGAVGRPRRRPLHGRPHRRRDARPQRAAPGPLGADEGRLDRPGLRGRDARHPPEQHRAPRPPRAGPALPRRPRGRPRRLGRRGQEAGRDAAPVRGVAHGPGRPLLRPREAHRRPRVRRAPAPAAAGVRLHAGGRARPPDADGLRRRRADRLHGQRRRARGPVGQAPAALQLLQAAVRPGDEPADRPDPRGHRHVAVLLDRRAAQPARGDAGARAPPGAEAPRPPQRRDGDPAAGRPGHLQVAHARHHVARRRRSRRHPQAPGQRLRRGLRRDPRRPQRAHPLGPRGQRVPRRDPVAPGGRRDPPPPRPRGRAARGRPRHRVRGAARGPPLRHAPGLRRGGDQPVPDVRHGRQPRRPGPHPGRRRRRDGPEERRQGDRQGPPEGDLQDGDLDDRVVLRCADLRGGRPARRPRRPLLHRHGVAHRRRRGRGARAGDARAPRPRMDPRRGERPDRGRRARRDPAARRRHVLVAPRRRAPHVEPHHDLAAPARGPHG